ncbi:MAG: helix-turn-helix domain-containing protein [Candidatus Micrarchaeia archaeon]
MLREDLMARAVSRLQSLGFDVFSSHDIGGCFDIACRKDGRLFLLKVLSNIDSLDMASSRQLAAVAQVLGADCLVIGVRSKSYVLENGVAYERHGLLACTIDTMESVVGGGYVLERKFRRKMSQLDGDSLKKLRESRELTIAQLARISGVSEDTIYRYEHSLTLATQQNIGRLESALGEGIGRLSVVGASRRGRHEQGSNPMIFDFFGFNAVRTAGPADIVGSSSGASGRRKDASGRVSMVSESDRDMRTLERKSAQFELLSKAICANPFFIVKKTSGRQRVGSIPMLTHEEIAAIRSPEDLVRALEEKKKK